MQDYFDFNKSYDPPRIPLNTALLENYLALLDVKQGRPGSARQRFDKAGLLMTQMQSDRPSWAAQGRQLSTVVQAEILLAGEKAGEAIAVMEKEFVLTSPGMNPPEIMQHNMPLEQDVLARAYQKAGNLDKAIEVYRQLLTFEPSSQDRRMRIPVYHYRLAKLYEEKGLKDKAAEQYRIFLDLWQDADPGLPEPADAKKRLAGLSIPPFFDLGDFLRP
jgi:tetratricopeptide (TPR) repeat protein